MMRLNGAGQPDRVLRLRRAFTTITLPNYHGLCAEGEAGSSAVGGAEDAGVNAQDGEDHLTCGSNP